MPRDRRRRGTPRHELRANLAALGRIAHAAALYLVALAASRRSAPPLLAALGVLPWLDGRRRLGGAPVPQAGMCLQVGVTALLLLMLATIPSGARMLALDGAIATSGMSMQDVAEAYHHAHAGDRRGAFRLSPSSTRCASGSSTCATTRT